MLSNRQRHCLNAIGIRSWLDRSRAVVETARESKGTDPMNLSPLIPEAIELALKEIGDIPGLSSSPTKKKEDGARSLSAPTDSRSEPVPPPTLENWDAIIQAIQQCSACELAQNCSQKVPGAGNRQADLMIIGEGPGHDEDIQGEPFVGRSGQLLDKMLAAIGISRDQVFITNIVKCRPPNNRDPKQKEAQQCRAFLGAQIDQVKPRVMLSLGRVSAQSLLDTKKPVGKLIEQMHQLPGTDIPVKVTYHPAYLLRTPSAKAIVWQDLKLIHKILHP